VWGRASGIFFGRALGHQIKKGANDCPSFVLAPFLVLSSHLYILARSPENDKRKSVNPANAEIRFSP